MEDSSSPPDSRGRDGASLGAVGFSLAALALLAALAWTAVSLFRNPVTPAGADAPPDAFSAARALEHVKALAVEPRPTGTPANARAREYLLERLGAMGVEAEVQEAVSLGARGSLVRAARVYNVLARLPGRGTGGGNGGGGGKGSVLLMAHYDSVPWSPGAGDDASGVAAVLETLRALKAGPPLDNDVIVLLTDAEEVGLFGAHAFAAEHPWAQEVAIVLNVDARGDEGTSLMFRTSDANLALARSLSRAVEAPRATSMSYELMRLLPNETDLRVFLDAGVPGMDFAFIGGHPRYHSAWDTVERLSPVSLQHQGSYLLGLAREFGNQDLGELPAAGGTYFNLLGSFLVIYPNAWVLPLVVLALLLWIVLVVLGSRRGALPAGRAFGGALGLLLTAGAAAAAVTFALQQIRRGDPDFGWLPRGLSYESGAYAGGLVLLGAAVALLLMRFLLPKIGGEGLRQGAVLLWLMAALATALTLPGLSYFFLWPALLPLGLALTKVASGRRLGEGGALGILLSFLAAVPAVLVLAPAGPLILEGLGLMAATVLAVLACLFLGLLAPILGPPLTSRAGWLLPLAAVAGVVVLWVPPVTTSPFDGDHPRATTLFYCLDGAAGKASWASLDKELTPWTESFLGDDPQRDDLASCVPFAPPEGYRVAAAPVHELPAPEIGLVERRLTDDGSYFVTVRLQSGRQAPILALAVESLAPVVALSVNGKPAVPDENQGEVQWVLAYQGAAGEAVEVRLELREQHPVELRLVDLTWSLPPGAMERPPQTMPRPQFWYSDATVVASRAFY